MSGVIITTMKFSLRKEFTIGLYISLVIHAMNTTHQLHMCSTSTVFSDNNTSKHHLDSIDLCTQSCYRLSSFLYCMYHKVNSIVVIIHESVLCR